MADWRRAHRCRRPRRQGQTPPLETAKDVGKVVGGVIRVVAVSIGAPIALVEAAHTLHIGMGSPGVARKQRAVSELSRRRVEPGARVDRVAIEGVAEQLGRGRHLLGSEDAVSAAARAKEMDVETGWTVVASTLAEGALERQHIAASQAPGHPSGSRSRSGLPEW